MLEGSGASGVRRDDLQRELEARLRQQAAVAAVGQRALAGASFAELLDEIVTIVRDNLGVDLVGYLHCSDDNQFVRALAGVGWPDGYEHDGRLLPVVPGGLTARALGQREPLILDDTRHAQPPSPILVASGALSSILVPIHGERPLGLIGAHSRRPRRFTGHDAAFLAAAANVVAVAHGRLEAESALRHRATHDTLTGLPNRAQLYDALERAIGRLPHHDGHCALLLVDLDGFKEVNDTLGHPVGDALLRAVADRLQQAVGTAGTVCRLGGDEFAVMLPEIGGAGEAEATATRLLGALEDPVSVDGMPITVDASVGISVAPVHGDTPSLLLKRADVAMYRAKRYASRVQVFDSRQDGREPRRLALAGQLRGAVDDGQLILAYQPKVSLRDGTLVGAEALVRWDHPTEGLLLPGEFLPVVEPTATILALSRWVVDEAIAQAARWRHDGLDLSVAVNCSARYLQSPAMPLQILEALASHRFPADRLVVELTESALITNPTLALASVQRLVAAGVRISIDDFGTGFASLAQLERFPAAELKIDRSFVSGLGEAPDAAGLSGRREAIVRAVLDLGERLGIDVVAEGVETQAALDWLNGYRCPLVQGFFIARPLPAADLAAFGRAGRWPAPLLLGAGRGAV